VLHGAATYLLQDGDGQVLATHSISAGLDRVSVPVYSHLEYDVRVDERRGEEIGVSLRGGAKADLCSSQIHRNISACCAVWR